MTSAFDRAMELRNQMGEREAMIHATQCLVLAPIGPRREYWWNVVELIKYNGQRFDSVSESR